MSYFPYDVIIFNYIRYAVREKYFKMIKALKNSTTAKWFETPSTPVTTTYMQVFVNIFYCKVPANSKVVFPLMEPPYILLILPTFKVYI